MNKKLREILNKRVSLDANNDFETEKCWSDETLVLSENIDDTIVFFKSECTDEEFFWLSEVFSDVAEKTQSKDFVQALKQRLAQVTRDNYVQANFNDEHIRTYIDYDEYIRSVQLEIDYAESALIGAQSIK